MHRSFCEVTLIGDQFLRKETIREVISDALWSHIMAHYVTVALRGVQYRV